MNDAQLISRLADTDAYEAEVPLPDEIWTPDVALHEIERRTGMQTQDQPTQTASAPRPPTKKRWLVPALAGAAAVIAAIVVAVALLSGSDEPDVTNEAPLTPLEVGEAMNLAHVTGDVGAERSLYADDATFTDLASTLLPGSGRAVEDLPLSTLLASVAGPDGSYMRPDPVWPAVGPDDWDADGDRLLTVFDVQSIVTATEYAAGVSVYHTCTQADATTIVCDDVLEGFPFLTDPSGYQVTNTYTVVDGRITHRVLDYTNTIGKRVDAARVIDYQEWVRANRPELESRLFNFFGSLRIRPDSLEPHREAIAEWKAQS